MAKLKISAEIDKETWGELEKLSKETGRSTSDLLNEAISEYLQRSSLRSEVREHLDESMRKNEKLGHLLAK